MTYGLTSIDLPKASTIGAYAFYACTGLATISLPEATTVGNNAFDANNHLVSVYLPKVTSIGEEAFRICAALTGVYFSQNAPWLGVNAFQGANSVVAYYPKGRTGYDTWGYANTNTWVQSDNIYSLSVNGVVPDASGNINLGAVWKTNVWWAYASSNATEKTAFTNIYLGR